MTNEMPPSTAGPVDPQLYARLPPRLWALLIDGAILAASMMVFLVVGILLGRGAITGVLVAMVVALNLYDPLFVSVTGSTIGHRALNLKVVRQKDGERLGFGAAFLRWWLKWLLGLVSFAFVLTSTKHRSLHDMATCSIITARDPSSLRSGNFDVERPAPSDLGLVSGRRRILVIIGYSIGATILIFGVMTSLLSSQCVDQNVCSPGEEIATRVLGLLWLIALCFAIVLGWRTRLPGARVKSGGLAE